MAEHQKFFLKMVNIYGTYGIIGTDINIYNNINNLLILLSPKSFSIRPKCPKLKINLKQCPKNFPIVSYIRWDGKTDLTN